MGFYQIVHLEVLEDAYAAVQIQVVFGVGKELVGENLVSFAVPGGIFTEWYQGVDLPPMFWAVMWIVYERDELTSPDGGMIPEEVVTA